MVVGWKFAVTWDVVGAVVGRKWARSVSDPLQQVSLADLGMCRGSEATVNPHVQVSGSIWSEDIKI